MSSRTTNDVIGSLRREAQENSQGDLMVAAADEIERLRSLLNESTARWAAFSHDCYGNHYMLPEGGCGVYLDGFVDVRTRLREIRKLAGLPALLPPPSLTNAEVDARVAAARAARNRPISGERDFPLVGDPKPPEPPPTDHWLRLVPDPT